ncbi:MAG: LPS export ABC transporter ATP-binding protein [Candidatus Aminicenantales bacterium]
MSALKALNLVKSFDGRVVVDRVSIEINSGEIIALLGRNGAGKTTTFQMMIGLLKPDQGQLFIDRLNISSATTCQRAIKGITYLPQESSVFLKTSVENNLRMVLELKGYRREEIEERTKDLLEELGLLALARQPAYSLSGGERRRLEICRSLILKPRFLILDEPFTGIDPLTIIELQKILGKLSKKGIGIILSDHNVRDTLSIVNRAYIIDSGKILVEGGPEEIALSQEAKERFLGKDFKLETRK